MIPYEPWTSIAHLAHLAADSQVVFLAMAFSVSHRIPWSFSHEAL
jgi:hypothetical protein